MDKVVAPALQKIAKKCSRKQTELKAACDSVIEKCTAGTAIRPPELFEPYKLAIETKNNRILEVALESLEKLLAFRYLDCASDYEEGRLLADVLVESMCSCFDVPEQDDSVHLQLVKALLTAVTSPACEVHEASLRITVRTIFNINLISKNRSIQTSTKAALTQIVNQVIQRMESPRKQKSDTPKSEGDEAVQRGDEEYSAPVELIPETMAVELFCKSIVLNVADRSLNPSQTPRGEDGILGKAGLYGYCVVCNRSADYFCLQTKSSSCSLECRSLHLDLVSQARGVSRDDIEDSIYGAGAVAGGTFKNLMQKDAFLIFRALCKLSMKPILDATASDAIALRQKVLSLELLLSMLQHSGAVFSRTEKFILAVKQYLCLSLLKNSVCNIAEVFKLSLQIFLILVTNFKHHLKTEIGVFLTNIFLRVLETGNSSFVHKGFVLDIVHKICQDPQTIVDVYLNYDCDLEHIDVFERMLNDLSRVARGQHAADNWMTPVEEMQLKSKALQCLVAAIHSLVEWSKQMDKLTVHPSLEHPQGEGDRTVETAESEASSQELVVDSPQDFERRKQLKQGMDVGISRFNMHPTKGLKYLTDNCLVGNTPDAIARFFHTCVGLSKTNIGLYLGDRDDFHRDVRSAYVDSLDFTGLTFDAALRLFLSGFRLPGEAQQIDRLMEKYAERYCQNNPDAFASADTAYVLAYSVIMLNTDAHNPMVKNKMTKAEFLRNNRGIDQGNDLDAGYMEDLYDRIVNNEIQMDDADAAALTAKPSSELTPSQKHSLFHQESQAMVRRSQQAFREHSSHKSSVYYRGVRPEHVRSMFDVAWCPTLAAFSVLLEQSQDPKIIQLCLSGIQHAIRVVSIFNMEIERDAFVTSLAKFTFLHSANELLLSKHIESIKTLLLIARCNGDYLGSSWDPVLRCVSQLDHLHLIGAGAKGDSSFFEENASPEKKRHSGRTHLEKNSVSVAAHLDTNDIDSIFLNSTKLSSEAIVPFVRHLCAVSKEEITGGATPRMFCMQKIVEIASFNMSRIRIVWSKIWTILGEHFTTVALHPNLSVAMYAVDSLRQLAIKFLEKEELTNYSFQRDFLKPFDHILSMSSSVEIRELVVRCITQMVQARLLQIKSGWKNVFLTLTVASRDSHESITSLAFELVEKIMADYLHLLSEPFVDVVHCLAAFSVNPHSVEIGLKSIQHINHCARVLDTGSLSSIGVTDPDAKAFLFAADTVFTDSEAHVKLWFPILTGLSRVIVDRRADIRNRGIHVLAEVLHSTGSRFDASLWKLVFRGVLLPMFDDIHHSQEVDNEWLRTSCFSALSLLVSLFCNYYTAVKPQLPALLKLLSRTVIHVSDGVAAVGVAGLSQLLTGAGTQFSAGEWDLVIGLIRKLFSINTPSELRVASTPTQKPVAQAANDDEEDFSDASIKTKCLTQLLLVQAVNDLLFQHADILGGDRLSLLLDTLHASYAFARAFNRDMGARSALQKAAKMEALPSLWKQEAVALSAYLRFLLHVFAAPITKNKALLGLNSLVEPLLISQCVVVLEDYLSWEVHTPSDSDGSLMNSIVSLVVQGLCHFTEEQFNKHIPRLYPYLFNLLSCRDENIRCLLTQLFQEPVYNSLCSRFGTPEALSPTASCR